MLFAVRTEWEIQRCLCVCNLQISHNTDKSAQRRRGDKDFSDYTWKHCSVPKECTALNIYIYFTKDKLSTRLRALVCFEMCTAQVWLLNEQHQRLKRLFFDQVRFHINFSSDSTVHVWCELIMKVYNSRSVETLNTVTVKTAGAGMKDEGWRMDVDRDADGGSVFSAAGGESAACAEHHTCL